MTQTIDVFWSFRSPYSYLATGRLVALARDYDIHIRHYTEGITETVMFFIPKEHKDFGNAVAG